MTSQSANATRTDLLRTAFKRVRSSVGRGLAAIFVILLAVVGATLWLRYDDALTAGERNVERLVDILAVQLAVQIDSVEMALVELAAHSRFIGGPNASGQEWMPILNVVSAGRHGVEALMLTDDSGSVTYSSLPIFMGQSRADGNSFRHFSENPSSDDLITDEPIRSTNDSRIVVPIGRVLRTPRTEFEGVALANLAPEKLRDFYSAIDVGENGIVWLLKEPDFVLLREPRSATPNDEPWPAISLANAAGTVIAPIESGGQDYLTVYRTNERTGLSVAVSLPLSDVLRPWWNEVYALVAFTVVVGIILLGATIVVRRTTSAGEATLDDVDNTPS